jgi:Ca2+-binding EF-hand superfamily protein
MDREIFDSYDTDKDGRLDTNELKNFLKDMECINENDSDSLKNDLVDKLMEDIDENKDKKISYEEYKKYTDKL